MSQFVGLPRMYSYDNWGGWPESTCGQAAIATVMDYFGCNPFGLSRTVAGQGIADDGHLHFDNDTFVEQVTRRFPPTTLNIPLVGEISFTVWETLANALRWVGLRVEPAYPRGWSDGSGPRRELIQWLTDTRLPVVALLDMPQLGFKVPDYTLHWGVIHAVDEDSVWMASWHQGFRFSWDVFLRGWHCKGLLYPNNYFRLHVMPPSTTAR